MKLNRVLFFLFFLCSLASHAQFVVGARDAEVYESNRNELVPDSSVTTYRTIPQETIDDYKKKTKYKYYEKEQKLSLIERFLIWLDKNFKLKIGKPDLSEFFTLLLWVLRIALAGLIFYILSKVLKLGIFKFNKPANQIINIPFEELEKNIHEVDFDPLIADAKKNKNYRAAIRLQYLKSLKLLSNKGMIKWSLEKTNKDYYYELKQADTQNKYKQLASLFEYVWYGEFDVDQLSYTQIEEIFTHFFNDLKPKYAQ